MPNWSIVKLSAPSEKVTVFVKSFVPVHVLFNGNRLGALPAVIAVCTQAVVGTFVEESFANG